MNRKGRFHRLLEPGYIGSVKTRNRIVKSAGEVLFDREPEIAFYEAIARGGAGLVIVGCTSLDDPVAKIFPGQRHIDDEQIPLFSEWAEVLHKYGCPTFMQLAHHGPWHNSHASGLQPWCASSLTASELPEPRLSEPRGMTIPEIEQIVHSWALAAKRAQKAGYDGVEVHAGTKGLLNSFLSRVWNKRQDAYGCATLESRAQIIVEIIRAVKEQVGWDYPVGVLVNGAEYGSDKATTPEEVQGFARIIEQAGADYIQLRAYNYGNPLEFPEQYFHPEPPEPVPRGLDGSRHGAGAFVPLAEGIKKVVSIPVIVVGRLDPIMGEKVLRQGKADFIAINRRILADPELPNKVASGRLDDIVPCTACCHCIWQHVKSAMEGKVEPYQVRCRVNAALGKERKYYVIEPAARKKKVVVVGGGPAGMEAARVAALKGHEVILYEREPKLGGLLPLAAVVKGLEIEDLTALVGYFKNQITKLGVKIRLGQEVTPGLIEEIKPDVVILATGGIPTVPEITGIDKHNVISTPALHRRLKIYLRFLGPRVLRWLTRFWIPLGKRVVIIGGGIQGCELAEFLIKRGRKVTIVDTAEELGEGLEFDKLLLPGWLAKKATVMTEVKYEEITDKGLTIITKEGKRQSIEADTIVPATPLTPNAELLKALQGRVPEIYLIGDCRKPGLVVDAIADGSHIAHAI